MTTAVDAAVAAVDTIVTAVLLTSISLMLIHDIRLLFKKGGGPYLRYCCRKEDGCYYQITASRRMRMFYSSNCGCYHRTEDRCERIDHGGGIHESYIGPDESGVQRSVRIGKDVKYYFKECTFILPSPARYSVTVQ